MEKEENNCALDPQVRKMAHTMIGYLRREYSGRCQGSVPVQDLLEKFKEALLALPDDAPQSFSSRPQQIRELLRAVRPLLAYSGLGLGERQHRLTEVGRELARLSACPPPPTAPGPALRHNAPKTGAGAAKDQPTVAPQPTSLLPPAPGEKNAYPDRFTPTPPPAGVPMYSISTPLASTRMFTEPVAKRFAALGLNTIEDMLNHLPKRWEDRTRLTPISQTTDGAFEVICGILGSFTAKTPKAGMKILESTITDASGTIRVSWFNQPYIAKQFLPGRRVVAFGKVERDLFGVQLKSPEVEYAGHEHISVGRIVPIYRLSSRLTQAVMQQKQYKLVPTYAAACPNPLPPALEQKHGFMDRPRALREYHWPSSYESKDQARTRLAFEELFMLQVQVAMRRAELQAQPRQILYDGDDIARHTAEFLKLMPFSPTKAQSRVFSEIVHDLQGEFPMNRLLQGDVGSGKTMVAAYACFLAIRQGCQAALMAPTEILAEQHFHKLSRLLEPTGLRVARLQGCLSKKTKQKVCTALEAGDIDLLIGTHALIQDTVNFANLGLVVVDEQHKFGVMQRTTLKQKGRNPDLLVMTATPIPRTMSLTLFGDLDSSRLDELPPGRQPIRSIAADFKDAPGIYDTIRMQIDQGRQAYVVCPLIDENDKIEAASAIQEAEHLAQEVFPRYKVGLLHGRMKAAEKDAVMEQFRQREFDVLISTTVIEVGVDVPNATIMLILNADRFGLAQLHQLRGRVGRGEHASLCIFMGQAQSYNSARKLQAIARLSDGFEVAEEDLEIRGPGDYYGVRQSGLPEFNVADLLSDGDLLNMAKEDARELVEQDPELLEPQHRILRSRLTEYRAKAAEMVH